MERTRAGQARSLVQELRRTHRFMVGALCTLLVITVIGSSYLMFVTQPAVDRFTQLTRQTRLAHEAMLNQETGLRGWLATGDEEFLEPFTDGRDAAAAAKAELVRHAEVSGPRQASVVSDVVAMLLARQAWETWAEEVVARGYEQRAPEQLDALLTEGRLLFDAYREADASASGRVVGYRDTALARQRAAIALTSTAYLGTFAAAVTLTLRRRRLLTGAVLRPVEQLLGTIESLRAGDLGARPASTGVSELDTIGSALGALAGDLQDAGVAATDREQRMSQLVRRLEAVVRVTREVSASLSVRYVAEAVTTAAADLVVAPASLWLPGEDGVLHRARRSDDPHGQVPSSDAPAPEVVAAVAADARAAADGSSHAYPLVLAGSVVGVLQVERTDVDAETEQVLEALTASAAAALESARLHSTVRELAEVDALTQLANRRRFEVDLAAEWDRCRRYGRPLTFLMLDLDHFKRLNDEYGHVTGDAALRATSIAVADSLRSTDTAYRYGGEEIAVLLRETDGEEAAAVAERVREAVAAVRLPESPVRVTGSIGVAGLTPQMADRSQLVTAADEALYAAKRQGRNRVVHAGGVLVPA